MILDTQGLTFLTNRGRGRVLAEPVDRCKYHLIPSYESGKFVGICLSSNLRDPPSPQASRQALSSMSMPILIPITFRHEA